MHTTTQASTHSHHPDPHKPPTIRTVGVDGAVGWVAGLGIGQVGLGEHAPNRTLGGLHASRVQEGEEEEEGGTEAGRRPGHGKKVSKDASWTLLCVWWVMVWVDELARQASMPAR